MENIPTEHIAQLVLNEGRSNAQISEILQRLYPNQRGLSERSVRRFCCENGISRRSGLNDDTLQEVVNKVSSVHQPQFHIYDYD